jgi:hypothetical protein
MAGSSDNGNFSADGGSPDDQAGLPGLPEDWGTIVIPDDLSELSDEVDAIRAELDLDGRQTRWRRLLHRPALRWLSRLGTLALRAPVLIVSLAVLVTVASLFASAWPGPPRHPATQRTAESTTEGTDETGDKLPALELVGTDGHNVPLLGKLPAVILLTDGCDCRQLVTATTAAAPPQITVVVIDGATSSAPGAVTPATGATPQAQGKSVLSLHDSSGLIRSELKVGKADDATAAALLVDRSGVIVRRVSRLSAVDVIKPDLARLT